MQPNKEMKLTKPGQDGASQLDSRVPRTTEMRDESEPAGHWNRLVGILIELCLATVVVAAAYRLVDHGLLGRTTAPLNGTAAQVSLLAWFLLNTYLMGRTGQSWGGKLLGLKVVSGNGESIGFWKSLGRNVFAVILTPFALGWFSIPWDPNKQAWHDKVFRTYVIQRVRM